MDPVRAPQLPMRLDALSEAVGRNVQVIVGVVMVAGWPIAHDVWEGNRVDNSTVPDVISDLQKRFEYRLAAFRRACGMDRPLRIDFRPRDGGAVSSHVCDRPFLLIGRDPRADLVLDHPDISRRHAYLQMIGGRWFALDLKSRAGIRWADGPRLSGWVEAGYTLSLGAYLLRIVDEGAEVGGFSSWPDPLQAPPPGPCPAVTLERTDWAEGPSRVRLESVLNLLGDAPECRLWLTDASVSRYHAALIRMPSGAWVVDLLSRRGIEIEGQRVSWAALQDGSSLKLGDVSPCRVGLGREPLRSLAAEEIGFEPARGSLVLEQPLELFGQDPLSGEIERLLLERSGEGGRSSDALVLELLRQFGLSQQRMFEQFTQAMLYMSQSMGTLQRDQTEMVRRELDQIRVLSRELRQLQARAAPRPAPAASAPEPPPATAPVQPPESVPRPGVENPPPPGIQAPHDEIHTILTQRIARLQKERQGRWQRLVGMVANAGNP